MQTFLILDLTPPPLWPFSTIWDIFFLACSPYSVGLSEIKANYKPASRAGAWTLAQLGKDLRALKQILYDIQTEDERFKRLGEILVLYL